MNSCKELINSIKSICDTNSISLEGLLDLDVSLNDIGVSSIEFIKIISNLEKIYRKKIDVDKFIGVSNPSIRQVFSEYIEETPLAERICKFENSDDRKIIDFDGSVYSYKEFFKLTNFYAEELDKNIERHGVIVIDLDKSIQTVAVIIACIISSNGYCILDRDAPFERRKNIIEEVMPAAIISDNDYSSINFKSYSVEEIGDIESSKDTIKYPGNIIFTSGSTGKPKGVKLSFNALYSYLDSMLEILPERRAKWLSIAPMHFDIYQLDFLLQLARGMDIVIASNKSLPQHIVSYIKKYDIQETIFVSTMIKMICSVFPDGETQIESLDKLYYGAESCPVATLENIKEIFPNADFCQFYGPSENTNNSTFFQFDSPYQTSTGFMPLGKAIKNTTISLVNDEGEVISDANIIGQIRISGSQLMDGYLMSPNNEKHSIPVQQKQYLTGDYAYFDDDGLLWFTGRQDDLVKIRGNRLSLQEVEIAMFESFAGVKHAVPFVIERDGFSTLVLGYVGAKNDIGSIKNTLRNKLPKYGVPEKIVNIPEKKLKYLSTGKIDKNNIKKYVLNKISEGEIA